MRPDDRDLDEEIRGHLALEVQDRVARGEHPEAARLAALQAFGYVPAVRDAVRGVWRHRWHDAAEALWQDVRLAVRAVRRAPGLALTVMVTLALGIGANAAVYSVVRAVLLEPLANRGADRLVYIRQGAPGLGTPNIAFSIPEILDISSRATTISAFGDFSTIDFTLLGFGEPRVVRAGVVGGAYFDVMGLRPVLGRLLTTADDGPAAAPVAVLTYRFWTTVLDADPSILGRTIRLDTRAVTVVGVIEPSVPYPAETEIVANVVTSSHHLDATMVTERQHRMTELFGRLAPGASVADARVELEALHADMRRAYPDAYPAQAGTAISVTPLGEQLTAQARPVLLVLLAVAVLVFVIACANVANLILARAVRREGEIAVRAALGASRLALRRMLFAESLILCAGGAALGVAMAPALVGVLARYASRFSARAHDVTIDTGVLWIGAGLAVAVAALLASLPRLPDSTGTGRTAHGRVTRHSDRRLRAFATAQIAGSFVLLAVAGALVSSFVTLRAARTGLETEQVLAIDVPQPLESEAASLVFFEEALRRVGALPGVTRVAAGNVVPWRDTGILLPVFPFVIDGGPTPDPNRVPHARLRTATPGYFAALGIPVVAGRDFTDEDTLEHGSVVVVSESVVAQVGGADAIGREFRWDGAMMRDSAPRRIIGVVADVDDEHVLPSPALNVYHPLSQFPYAGRLFVQAAGDAYALVPAITQTIRELSAEQPVARAATLEDIRAEVIAPDRVSALVVTGFATVALLIAAVGVAGVLGLSVSARRQEFGVRLAIGATPGRVLTGVMREGVSLVVVGLSLGAVGGYAVGRFAAGALDATGASSLSLLGAAAVLIGTALVAALVPAARASRVDVLQALRSE